MVADAAGVKWLVLRLRLQSGFVAYLNGLEIARQGLTNTPPAFNDYADFQPDTGAVDIDVSAATGALVTGENVLAIELHTAITNEPGPAFTNHMLFVPELLANFQRGPFVQNASTNRIQVIWRTPVPADTAVDFGTDQTFGSGFSDATLTTNHVATLTNLLPGTRYFYRVRSTAGAVTAESPTNSFTTFKASGDVCFLMVGDSGDGSAAQYSLAAAMEQAGADLVVHVGDVMEQVVYPEGQEDLRCLSVYHQMMGAVPFFFAMGNHDVGNNANGENTESDDWYLDTFYLPTNSATGTEHFYSFDHGDVHFVVLYVPDLINFTNESADYEMYDGSIQYRWLTNDLAASSKPWKFIFLHQPLDTSGNHRFDNFNQANPHYGTSLYDWQALQNLLLPVAQRYGVQMFFSGHSHDFERFMPIDGVHLIVNGCGGRGNTPIDQRDASSSQFFSTVGVSRYTKVTIHGDSLLLQGIQSDGTIFDYMTIQRAPPAGQFYDATWNTPIVEGSPANDGFGNIAGQTFNFVGTAIPALLGNAANLGRVYVNNDATNLYIGFEQAMLPSNSTVLFFIESPRQSGVANLIGLGDGIAGSDEGVDGLDFLENLSYTNFTPSVALLLGDEHADAQSRHFVRPGTTLDTGQGVFRLDASFSDVPGVRIQQFNRSPQSYYTTKLLGITNTFADGNADFMEVAIPLEQLGGLQLGDTIKIAAVVGLGGCDTNAQTRELDTGFLGSSMAGSGQSNVVLGAISVRLAPKILTVKADDQTRTYGATNPTLTVTYDGFVNGEDASALGGSPAISTPAGTNSAVGGYPIEVNAGTLTNAHYQFVCTNGTLTITPAILTIKAVDATRTYGATTLSFFATFTGFVDGEDTNIVSGAPLLSTSADTNSPVGTYWITPGMGSLMLADTNYSLVFSNGTLTVTPASLTIKALDAMRTYGATNPPFTAIFIGFVNGQDTNILSGETLLSTSAGNDSPAGNYWITVDTGSLAVADTNYSLIFSNGILAVTPAGTTNTLSSSLNPATNGLTVTFTATVSPIPPAMTLPTGNIGFLTNGVLLMSLVLSNGVASISLDSLPTGTNEVIAAYLGDDNYLGSTNRLQQLVLAPPVPNLILSMTRSGANTFTITLAGATNTYYCLLETTNLAAPMSDWTVVMGSTNIATNGVCHYTITNAAVSGSDPANLVGRFFRAKAVNPP